MFSFLNRSRWKRKRCRQRCKMRQKNDERLVHDHAELGELLGQLIKALDSNDVARTFVVLDLFWARLAIHIRAEHLHLFPAISHAVSRSFTVVSDDVPSAGERERIIEELRHDHDFFMRELSQAVVTMRGLLANPKADAGDRLHHVRTRIDAVQQRLLKHNEDEEKGIYLWTSRLLSEAEQSELAALVKKELENTPPRFEVKTN